MIHMADKKKKRPDSLEPVFRRMVRENKRLMDILSSQ